jgi:hypothetical protein
MSVIDFVRPAETAGVEYVISAQNAFIPATTTFPAVLAKRDCDTITFSGSARLKDQN